MEGYDKDGDPLVKGIIGGAAVMAGAGTLGQRTSLSRRIEAAMSQAVLDCAAQDPPVTDPDLVRAAMLEARERVKQEDRQQMEEEKKDA